MSGKKVLVPAEQVGESYGDIRVRLLDAENRGVELSFERIDVVMREATPAVQPAAKVMEPSDRDLYASYANHCAIQKKVPLTWHSWKREKGQWCHDVRGKRVENEEMR